MLSAQDVSIWSKFCFVLKPPRFFHLTFNLLNGEWDCLADVVFPKAKANKIILYIINISK